MELKADIFAKGNELCNVKILKDSFIELKKNENSYCINCNKQGLSSFIFILNKLKSFRYNFIHLADIHINDFYVHCADYFFDYPSMALDIYKIKSSYKKDNVSEYEGLNEQLCLQIYLQRKTFIRLVNELKMLIKKKKGIICFKFEDKLNSVLNINLNDHKAKRQ